MKHVVSILSFALLISIIFGPSPAKAGEPDQTPGGVDPNHYVCAAPDHVIFDLDSDAFNFDGSFNPDVEVDVEQLEEDCDELDESLDARIELIQQSRIEGFVFEFHPAPEAPGGWQAVASRDVPVVASGPGFEVFWGTEKDGFYSFDYLGAGPVTLNLRLPPDAHPINPNITVVTTGFDEITFVPLGFYRGDVEPKDIDALRLPPGVNRTGQLPPGDTIFEDFVVSADDPDVALSVGMPNVGGVLPQDRSLSTVTLAVALLAVLSAAGIRKVSRSRSRDQSV